MMRKSKGFCFLLCVLLLCPGVLRVNAKAREEAKPATEAAAEETEPLLLEQAQQDSGEGPVASYLIEAQLYPKLRRLTASQTLTWRNATRHTMHRLRFHLYYNAFRDTESTFMQESGYNKRPEAEQQKLKFGEIRIAGIRRLGGAELTGNMRFIRPDDGNEHDRTVMELELDKPVQPGQRIRLKIEFVLAIPGIFMRTGAEGSYFFMGQWYPKIGVLLSNGQWHCHQFHRDSEFFADFGEYHAAITVPEGFLVGATGNQVKKEKTADRTVTYQFHEKNIHDFAWTAYTGFKKFTEKISLEGGGGDTVVELLLPMGHRRSKERYLNILEFSMHFFARHIFPYPYKKLTLVDPPLKGMMSGGMEYPTLITVGYVEWVPGAFKFLEAVTVHEFAHQYWYGIVGTDEFREAWLDEGAATFFELEIMDLYFRDSASYLDSLWLKVDDWETVRHDYASLLPVDRVDQDSWEFLDYDHYAGNTAMKAAILLRSLKNLVGKEQMYNFFRYYAEKYKFKHPTGEDFIDTFNAFMNDDYTWAFDLYIRGEGGLDHAVHAVESVKIASNPDKYRNEAVFVRKEGYFPVELSITLENGKEIKSFWKAKERWKKIVFDDVSPIKAAMIDPLYHVPLDRNFLNNSKVRKANPSGIRRLALRIGFLFQDVLGVLIF